jgi:hypothetical protein
MVGVRSACAFDNFRQTRYYFFAWVEEVDKPRWILATVYGDASYRNNLGI